MATLVGGSRLGKGMRETGPYSYSFSFEKRNASQEKKEAFVETIKK